MDRSRDGVIRRGGRWLNRAVLGLALAGAVLLGLGAGVRLSLQTDVGRGLAVQLVNGLASGPWGRLRLSGLKGDLFSVFSLKDLSISDARGSWLTITDLNVRWNPIELLGRRLHITRLSAGLVRIDRAPSLKAQARRPASKPPVSVMINSLSVRLETEPGFSVKKGLWMVSASALIRRSGAVRTAVTAKSLLHPGDGADFELQLGRADRFRLRAEAREAEGGALAGALGLPTTAALEIHAVGDGDARSGSAEATARSGAAKVIDGRAAWTDQGLSAHGEASLGASSWTRFLAERIGPTASLAVAVRRLGAPVLDLDGVLTAAGGSIRAKGPVDWRRGVSSGLRVDMAVTDLSRWLPAPKIGPAHFNGSVSGSIDRFRAKGLFQARDMVQFGYHLASLSGPVTASLGDGEWRAEGNLKGAGAGGTSVADALLGPSPEVRFDASLLKTDHVLIRSLEVKGARATLSAEGGQGFFGRLSFKGVLSVPDLAVVRPGAKGALQASWTAGEGADALAWDFAFQGQASKFSTGAADLDHFIGADPHLTAEGSYGLTPGLRLRSAHLHSGTVDVSASGAVDPTETLALDLTWSAKGPFSAGPLQIAGAAKGTGKITGALASPRADLEADLAALDLGPLLVVPAHVSLSLLNGPDGVLGAAAVNGSTAQYGPATAKADFRFGPGGLVALTDVVADAGGLKLAGSFQMRQGALQDGDLTLAAGPGAFLTAGRLQGRAALSTTGGIMQGSVALDGADMVVPDQPLAFHVLKLRAAGPLRQLPFQLTAEGPRPAPWAFTGSGVFAHDATQTSLSLLGGGRVQKADFSLTGPALARWAGPNQSIHAALTLAGGRLEVDLRRSQGSLLSKAELSGVGVGAFNEAFVGAVSGALTLRGLGSHLAGGFEGRLNGVRSRDAPTTEGLSGTVKATLKDERLHIDAVASDEEGLKASGAVDLPAETAQDPFRIAVDRTKPLTGEFSADGEIRPLWDLFAGGERTLSGRIETTGTLHGTWNTVFVSGQAALTGGRFRDIATGLSLQSLGVDASFGDDAVTVKRFSGVDGRGGSISGDGRVSFAEDGASTFTLNLKKFQLLDNDLGRATASGAVNVTHPAKGQGKLTGNLTIDRADIVAAPPTPSGVVPLDVVEIHQPVRPGQDATPARALGPPINLDVGIKAPRGVYVKGKGLNVELSLDAHVGGTVLAPDLSGAAKVVSGAYDFAGKRFDLDSAGVIHLGDSPAKIRLDLTASWEDPTLTAVVRVQGTAAKPEITLTSIPVLPQDEVLARVLFGTSASQLTAAQGAEMASALSSLAGGGGFDVIGNLRQFAGLDRLTLGSTQAQVTTISGGKYLSKDVYLELTGGARNGSGAQVEWRIRKNLALVSRYGAALDPRYPNDTDASLSIRFRTDF